MLTNNETQTTQIRFENGKLIYNSGFAYKPERVIGMLKNKRLYIFRKAKDLMHLLGEAVGVHPELLRFEYDMIFLKLGQKEYVIPKEKFQSKMVIRQFAKLEPQAFCSLKYFSERV